MSIIVRARDKDNTDSLIRKFQKIVASEGVIQQYRDREYYKKNSIKRQERLAEKRRKIMRAKRYANQ
ncbi:30S ribosomal protein S21 [Candidatus Daviesbacteria bacterium RIFCSPHIGHO2_01_FULL_44_29]|uniref:Small ribosomal subunit protein bS21 n=1 Tax=Candidatus Daviesbacteria bacterium RIFCSPHIGHO2_02_FULL_43_12 TaxID=1797776 RepID=A0A1F5KII5_9BACT|nr:MAG: 30S ribosomal protein S21 [Candidatus Daviesbacteria bacterium RIFCSPHIGHO2_01_FULL_44_29]OGE39471.1 MAG: 30S ribosomal protein S21 [Candidatus Daviesbacteria bacterium RIFCSPHIGHO2_12_FULL_47_45]OGE40630.1 MAG: 30S ribosomal protein S21 [Candidatus Daviesbacteria bacterium RIFCSPHIGHO2_02_FULL_43_12]OGE69873.1 MAG: 30S ribosomal protein S21 [Candidatus Daviesbacteria bacterium RIFCSPLOWO2_01_FULL_43_15]